MSTDLTPAQISDLRNQFLLRAGSSPEMRTSTAVPVQRDSVEVSGGGSRRIQGVNDAMSRGVVDPARVDSSRQSGQAAGESSTPRANNAPLPPIGAPTAPQTMFPGLELGAAGADLLPNDPAAQSGLPLTGTAGLSSFLQPDGTFRPVTTPAPAPTSQTELMQQQQRIQQAANQARVDQATAAAAGATQNPVAGGANLAAALAANAPPTGPGGTIPPGGTVDPAPGTPGQVSQADAMTREQMIRSDRNQANLIYMQIMADQRLAFQKMIEIMQGAQMQMWSTMQDVMVNRAKAVETANKNFSDYLRQ